MRRPFPHFRLETFTCGVYGHHAVAEDGVDHGLTRCARCDAWLAHPESPPRSRPPRRGKALRDAVVLRLVAINKGLHSTVFFVLFALLTIIDVKLPGIQHWTHDLSRNLHAIARTAPDATSTTVQHDLDKVSSLHGSTLHTLMLISGAYFVCEGIETVGLWRERRWAEYLTCLATIGFMPLEIHEIYEKVTLLRLGALALNTAILLWLLWSKRLFGIRGGHAALLALEEAHTAADIVGDRQVPHIGVVR